MTETGLTAATHLVGLIFAVGLARAAFSVDAGSAELRRLDGAVKRAVDVQLWRSFRRVAAMGAGALALVLVGQTLRRWFAPTSVTLPHLLVATLGFVVGLSVACLTAQVGAQLARASAVRGVGAARTHAAGALVVLIRAAGAAALLAVCSTVLASAGIFLLAFAADGGFAGPGQAASAATHAAGQLAFVAFGSAVAALVIQRAGAVYRTSAAMATGIASEQCGGPELQDARNPALVAGLVGSHVGRAASRVVDLQVAVAAGAAVLASLAVTLRVSAGGHDLSMLPIVVFAFATVSGGVGLLVVRVGPGESLATALFRSLLASAVVAAGGLAGASVWLGSDRWWPLFVSGLPALGSVMGAAYLARLRTRGRVGAAREIATAGRNGPIPTFAAGFGAGLESIVAPITVTALGLSLTWQLGARTGIAQGGELALATATALVLSATPFVLALAALDVAAHDTGAVLSLTPDGTNGTIAARLREVDEAGFVAGRFAQPFLILVGGLVSLGAAWVLGLAEGGTGSSGGIGVGGLRPDVLWVGAAGAAAVLALVGNAARSASRGALDLAAEVDRQLRRFPRERGVALIPATFTPSYRACTELAAVAAARGSLPLLGALAVPLLVVLVPSLLGATDPLQAAGGGPPLQALGALLVVVTTAGVGTALAAAGSGALLSQSRRAARRPSGPESDSVAIALGETMTTTVGPTALLLIKVVAAGALALALGPALL